MPEGPEVRCIADVIERGVGKTFVKAEVIENVPEVLHRFSRNPIQRFELLQKPWQLTKVETKGKVIFLWIESASDSIVGVNTLAMSGTWKWNGREEKHARLNFVCKGSQNLTFLDVQSYGTFKICTKEEAFAKQLSIGSDLLNYSPNESFWDEVQADVTITNLPVAEALLTQHLFSGIGNIYRSEIAYLCSLDPHTLVSQISRDKWRELGRVAHEVLRKAYEAHGTSIQFYEANGKKGQNQYNLRVYGKKVCDEGAVVSYYDTFGRRVWWCPDRVKTFI